MSETTTERTPVTYLDIAGAIPGPDAEGFTQGEHLRFTVEARVSGLTVREGYDAHRGPTIRTGVTLDLLSADLVGASPAVEAVPVEAPAMRPATSRRLRRFAWGHVVWAAAVLALVGLWAASSIVTANRMEDCQAEFRKHFDTSTSAPVWTSPACGGLSLDEKAKVYARTVVDYESAHEGR